MKKRNVKKAFTKRVATLLVILMMAQTMFIPGFAVTSVFAQDTPNETVTEEAAPAEKEVQNQEKEEEKKEEKAARGISIMVPNW